MINNEILIRPDGSAEVMFFGVFGESVAFLKRDGQFTADVEDVFMNGHCHSFALAMHRLTGWGMMAICKRYEGVDKKDLDEYPDGTPSHIMVQHPNGALVDIHGFRDPRVDFGYSVERIIPVTKEQIMAFHNYMKPSQRLAMPYVKAVLKKIGWDGNKTVFSMLVESNPERVGA